MTLQQRVYFLDGPMRGQWQLHDVDTSHVRCVDQRGRIPVSVYKIEGNTARQVKPR